MSSNVQKTGAVQKVTILNANDTNDAN